MHHLRVTLHHRSVPRCPRPARPVTCTHHKACKTCHPVAPILLAARVYAQKFHSSERFRLHALLVLAEQGTHLRPLRLTTSNIVLRTSSTRPDTLHAAVVKPSGQDMPAETATPLRRPTRRPSFPRSMLSNAAVAVSWCGRTFSTTPIIQADVQPRQPYLDEWHLLIFCFFCTTLVFTSGNWHWNGVFGEPGLDM